MFVLESPLPPDANFTEEELSILDDVDLNDSKDVLQNIPSNASILFPDDIPCSSPWVSNSDNRTQKGDRSPSFIENTLEYVSRNGRVHGKRIMKTSCPVTCRKKCSEKLTEDIRQRIFDMFWSIGDHSRQWDFLARYAVRAKKKDLLRIKKIQNVFTLFLITFQAVKQIILRLQKYRFAKLCS